VSSRDDERRERDARARVGSDLVPGLALERLLALGDLGAVYAAERHLRGRVVVKLFHPELAHDLGSDPLRLLRRAEEIAHPRVVVPTELLRPGDARALVMPLVRGESLRALVTRRRGRIPPSEALRVTGELIEVIGTAHAHGLPHGALSLSHVLLDDSGAVHLLGFGEAALRAQLGLDPDRAFWAPEHDPRTPTEAADLWAVAAILFVLLTGSTPRPGRLALTEQAPRPLVDLVERAFDSRPERRFRDAGTFLAAVRLTADQREVQYAHPLGSALAAQSGSHALLDPVRVTEPPRTDPSWSSTPPARPQHTPPSRPPSEPPMTPRSRLVPTLPPAQEPREPQISERPPDEPLLAPRGTTPPSGTAPRSRSPSDPTPAPAERARRELEHDPLADLGSEELHAEAARMVALLSFDSALSLEDAWKAARQTAPQRSFDQLLAELTQTLGSADAALGDLALELSALASPDPARLIQVAASSLEGPSLGPALDAFSPALADHVQRSLEHEPQVALRLLRLLQDGVRAPKAILAREQTRVVDAVASPGSIQSLFGRLGARVSDARTLDALAALLPAVGPRFAGELGTALPQIADLTLRAKVLHHLESELANHEAALGELAREAEPHLAIELARILSRIDTLAARDALAKAAESRHAVVRIDALGLAEGASGERLRAELKHRLEECPATERIQTLRALSDYEVRVAAPFVALRLKSAHVDALPFEERRALFHALAVLAPSRAEAVAMEILGHKKLISSASHEETRALAASTLGEIASGEDALRVLTEHAERRFGTSDRVRQAAAQALSALHARPSTTRRPR